MTQYKIKQGNHYCSGIKFFPHFGQKFISRIVEFDYTSEYDHGTVDQLDINKLFGISYGYHHNNSARFGWRSLGWDSNKIEILAYCYVDGHRIRKNEADISLGIVNINQLYEYTIYTADDAYYLSVKQHQTLIKRTKIPHNGVTWWGYHLYPYFGGNLPAPHTIKIYIK